MARATPVEVTCLNGGALVTRASSENAGPFNYRIKRDVRRLVDGELRAEGYDFLWPNLSQPLGAQPLRSGSAINLIGDARASNGQTAIIAGNKTTLYRYFALETQGYYNDDAVGDYYATTGANTPYFATSGTNTPYYTSTVAVGPYYAATGSNTPYFDDNPGYWLEIGSGFSAQGHRWEAVNCGNVIVFNNGVDLPMTYSLLDFSVKPIYELRELGVARVGTIAEIDGVLICFDVTMLKDLPDWFADNAGSAYDAVTTSGLTVRIPSRALWADPSDARRFAASIPCAVTSGSKFVTLTYPVSSLESGQEVTILGAGVNGANLTTTIELYPGSTTLVIADAVVTTVADTLIARSDITGSVSGFEDLLEDGSAIVKALKLDGYLVLYRETGTQLASYTGDSDQPFDFGKFRGSADAALFYRNTLVSVTWNERTFHMYAGRNGFYRYDLAVRAPVQMELLKLCQDLFFDHVTSADDDEVYAALNTVTHEVFIYLPTTEDVTDRALRFDYENNTMSTTSAGMSAAATVKRPNVNMGEVRQTEDWFVMAGGANNGVLYLYGRTNQPNQQWAGANAIWNRVGEEYDSVLRGGLSSFGDRFNEKELVEYVLFLSSLSPSAELTVNFYGAENPTESPVLLGSQALATPTVNNLIPTHYLQYFFADEIVISGKDNPCTIGARIWNVYGARSDSNERRQ